VTDDASLINRANELRSRRREVFLNGQQHSTARVTARLSLEVLRDLYLRCGTCHEFWQSAMYSFNIHYTQHHGAPEQKHHQTAVRFFDRIYSDRKEKEHFSMTADLGEIFGAGNG